MRIYRGKMITIVVLIIVSLLSFSFITSGIELPQNDLTIINQAALNLVIDDSQVKAAAIETLTAYGERAFPHLVEIMKNHQGENKFVGYELLGYIEQLDNPALQIVKQGLYDSNSATRSRAAKLALNLGPEAASIVNDVANVVIDNSELTNVRSQAIDALEKIGTVTPEVKLALALSLTGDPMVAWKASRVIQNLNISYDELLDVLFEKLASEDRGYGKYALLTAIVNNLNATSDPITLLERELANPSDALVQNLFQFITDVYPVLENKSDKLIDLLFQLATNSSLPVRDQAIYCLGEIAQERPEITARMLTIIDKIELQDDVYISWAYALEKSAPNNSEVISFFINTLVEETSFEELRLTAARYLEKSGMAAFPEMLVLVDKLGSYDHDTLWRLSPLFYHVAKEEPVIIERLRELLAKHQPKHLQNYANRLLLALEDEAATPLQITPAISFCEKKLAFPGAEGYGQYTIGGRGGDVYVVSNLNSQGPGSLREAVEASGPRTVVFAVSGNIMLHQPLSIENPYITIAGQTAPGDGITISGAPVLVNTDQVIIRYIRFRLGDYHNFESDALEGRYISDIIVDHVSASWSTDETVSFYEVDNLTVQWSFITESLRGSVHVKGNHGYGGIWGGAASYHHNLMAHHSSRTPRFDGERTLSDPAVDMRNNIIYNWGFNSAHGGEGGNHNIIANYYKAGPGTGLGKVNHRIVEVSNGGKWYVAENFVYGYPEISLDNWAGGVQPRLNTLEEIKHEREFLVPPVTTHTAEEAYELILADAGVTLPKRDSIDQRIVEEVRQGTATYGGVVSGLQSGIIDSQDDVGGLPFLRSFTAPLDTDNNGIPDWWTLKHGFSPDGGLEAAGDIDGDGYTNLEEYLNGTNPLIADY